MTNVVIDENQHLPVLPLRNIVVFPQMIVPLFVGREKSVRALEHVMNHDKQILLVAQKDEAVDDPGLDDFYRVGCVGNVLQMLKLPDGTVKVLVEGGVRVRMADVEEDAEEGMFLARPERFMEREGSATEMEALVRTVVAEFEEYVKLNKKIPPEVLVSLAAIDEPGRLADTIASHLSLKLEEKQELLEMELVEDRLEKLYQLMENEIGVLQVEKRIRNRVKRQMEKTQREYYLNEQMKAIQKELGEEDGDVDEYEKKLSELKLSDEAREKAETELKKLKMMSPMSAEATVVRNYLDWIFGLPWGVKTRIKKDLGFAENVLDEDHYGLEKVKERIVEHLAVQQRVKKLKGPILCLVGPPGVGKTSLAKSIARATGRNYVRMALGGVRDEAEIRGHRRTYIGALPGKIIQNLKKAGSINPLFLLDEIDKLGADFRGDPSSALLEVLDPAQNSTFADHYMEMDFDLSDVMFLCTANSLNIPPALRDRMEVINLSGYTEDEKVEIAKRHLLTRSMQDNGLKKGELEVSEEAVRDAIRYYTREAGVRNLERVIQKICRKAVKEILSANSSKAKAAKGAKKKADNKTQTIKVTPKNLDNYLGVRQFSFGLKEDEDQVGVVTGLAWTQVGGDILPIEAKVLDGKGKMTNTGKLGDVMTESISAAATYVRGRWEDLGLDKEFYQKKDIHIHVPDGATPKDGPSAGLAMATAMVSALTGIPVRSEVAMTGEISLRGRAMQIGGLKEKLLAAHRAGITKVLIPTENEKDLAEIPKNVKDGLEIVVVAHIDEVLKHALTSLPKGFKGTTTSKKPAKKTTKKAA